MMILQNWTCGWVPSWPPEKVEKADKLLKLNIDLGSEHRVIVSGIAQHFKPEEIVGRQVVVVANLAPRKMRGIESNGMILMAEDPDGSAAFCPARGENRCRFGGELKVLPGGRKIRFRAGISRKTL